MGDIILINPPWAKEEQYGDKIHKVGAILPPLGLASIAAVLEENNFNVEILDCIALEINQQRLKKILENRNPKFIGITCLTPMASRSFQCIKTIRQALPEVKIITGGPHISTFPREIIKENKEVDICIYGEGELTILEILKKKKIKEIKGIAFRSNGKVILNPQRPFLDINKLPFPARHLLPMNKYKPSPANYRKLPARSLVTARGCPYHCIYCSKTVFGRSYRARKPKLVVDEIEILMEKYGAKEATFYEDSFTLDQDRIFKVCGEIKNRGLDIKWSCATRVDLVNKKLLEKMQEAGCWQIRYGVETGSEKLLKFLKKNITLEQVRKTFKITKEAGISIRANFMLGLPGETIELSKKTIDFAIELKPDIAAFFITIPFPGTELFTIAKEESNIQSFDWSKYLITCDESPIYVNNALTKDQLKDILKKAYKRFYLRPSFITKQLLKIRSVDDFLRMYRAARAIV